MLEENAPPCLNFLTKKAPYKGLGAESGEKHEPASDIDTAVVDSLKALDPNRPIREADISAVRHWAAYSITSPAHATCGKLRPNRACSSEI